MIVNVLYALYKQKRATKEEVQCMDQAARFYTSFPTIAETVNVLASESDYNEWNLFNSVVTHMCVPENIVMDYE